jgi:hypothetical protein
MQLSEDLILVLVLAAFLCVALLGFLFHRVFLRQRLEQRALLREILRLFDGMHILATSANAFFNGMDRSWDKQWRGPGVLILTEGMLYFRLSRRKLDLSIPLGRIQYVGIIHRQSKWPGSKLFQIRYRGLDDQLRVASWIVRRPHKWVRELQTAIKGIKHDGET